MDAQLAILRYNLYMWELHVVKYNPTTKETTG